MGGKLISAIMFFGGFVLLYGAIKNKSPVQVIREATKVTGRKTSVAAKAKADTGKAGGGAGGGAGNAPPPKRQAPLSQAVPTQPDHAEGGRY